MKSSNRYRWISITVSQRMWTGLCIWLCVELLRGQTVWRVNVAGGASVDFTDLPPAVAAAQDGDTILCWQSLGQTPPGWRGYTAPTINKSICLIGFTTYNPTIETSKAMLDGVLRIRNIAHGEVCVVANVSLRTLGLTTMQGCVVEDCAGSVVIDGIEFQNFGYSNQSFRIERSASVQMQGGYFTLAAVG